MCLFSPFLFFLKISPVVFFVIDVVIQIVISPLKSLMQDQVKHMLARGITTLNMSGDQTQDAKDNAYECKSLSSLL